MTLDGTTLSAGVATSPEGYTLKYRILLPSFTRNNLHTLAAQGKAWRGLAKQMEQQWAAGRVAFSLSERVNFAELVLGTVAENLRLSVGNLLVAEDSAGDIRGGMVYFLDSGGLSSIAALAIDPRLMLGVPGYSKYRGIGTAMVAVMSRIALQHDQTAVYLHPLDEAAKTFWLGRGFELCPVGSLTLCVKGRAAIERLIDGCYKIPEPTEGSEYLVCGQLRHGIVVVSPWVSPPIVVVRHL